MQDWLNLFEQQKQAGSPQWRFVANGRLMFKLTTPGVDIRLQRTSSSCSGEKRSHEGELHTEETNSELLLQLGNAQLTVPTNINPHWVYCDEGIDRMKMFVEPADIYLYMDIVDFRKSINGLIVVVEGGI